MADFAVQVYDDYVNTVDPFREEMLPEHLVRGGFGSDRNYSLFLTLVASIDKRKETMGENGLWKEAKRLWNEEQWIYEPEQVVAEREYEELIDLFSEDHLEQFNYYEDPHVWYLNSLTLYRDFDSNPMNLLEETGYNAPELLKFVRSDDYSDRFHSITGDKVGPLWVRLLDEEIHELEDIHEIDIPVDSRIQSITKTLMSEDYTKAEARNEWRDICDKTGLVPVRMDQPLWLIDKFIDDGDAYFENTSQEFQDYLDRRAAEVS